MTEAWRNRLGPAVGQRPEDLIEGTPLRDETHRTLVKILDDMTAEERQAELIRYAQRPRKKNTSCNN